MHRIPPGAILKKPRLAIVDDAFFIREGLRRLLQGNEAVEVVGTAASGEELLTRMPDWQPDVVTLDLHMPGMGGLATLDRLMKEHPVPVIILSTHSGEGAPITLEALSRGAVDFIDKEAHSLVDFEALRAVLLTKVLHVTGYTASPRRIERVTPRGNVGQPSRADVELIVIGASTGGPRAIEALLQDLGPDVRAPVVIVQHMPAGFTNAFAARLDRLLPLHVREITDGDTLLPGTVGIAPAGKHLSILRHAGHLKASLHADTQNALHVPSVDVLFNTAAEVTAASTVAVLLTGMGSDGAHGMLALSEAGAHTIAQDEHSCVVYGMPRAAVAKGAVRELLPLDAIGLRLRALTVR